ncbi:MAG: hypothetical protein WDZ72_01735 [Cyclobacteriaceae bacterium]
MKFIDELLGGLFSGKNELESIKENFEVPASREREVAIWMESEEGLAVLDKIYRNYHLKKAGVNNQPEIHLLNTPYANGFAISFQNPLSEKIFSNLFFGFGQRMLDLGYKKVSLDRKMQDYHTQVKTTEKLYFKPPFHHEPITGKMDQLFGNVSIENVYLNKTPNYLKVLVTVYADHQYYDARPFDQYMDQLFKAG